MAHLNSDGPMDLVCMDFLSIEPDSRNICNVLVVTDHYTRYAQAFATKDQKASTVARVLWEQYFVHYGLPRRVHSDQGRDFESRLIHELLSMLGIKKSRTTPYHPQGDPQPERFNRTLLDMLGTLETKDKCQWSKHLSHLVHAYNCTRNDSTGYSPYFLMFGREARLPVDVTFGVASDGTSTKAYLRYVKNMKRELQAAYQLAESMAEKKNGGNKQRYDQRVCFCPLDPGDRVLIRNLGLQGKHKLADRWKDTPYVVESQRPGLPVFKLKPESGHGPEKVLHRNHILPIGQEVQLRSEDQEKSKPKRRASKRLKAKMTENCDLSNPSAPEQDVNIESASESENDEMGVWSDYYPQQDSQETELQTNQHSEPFSLDLDLTLLTSATGMEGVTADEPGTVDVNERSVPEETVERIAEAERDTDTQMIHETDNQDGVIETSEKTIRPQRQKRVPHRLTYDLLEKPSSVAVGSYGATLAEVDDKTVCLSLSPMTRYISTFYKWIG